MKQISFLLAILALVLVACSGDNQSSHGHDDGHDAGDNGHSHDSSSEQSHGDRVPNNGAVVRIVSPVGGATFSQHDQVIVEITTENFVLGEDGNHWHVYANGISYGMIMGTSNEHVISGLEPGEYELTVYLADGLHRDLEDGATIQITVRAD